MSVSGSVASAAVSGVRKKDAPADYRDFGAWKQTARYKELVAVETARAVAVLQRAARFEARTKARAGV